jgi:hypothetical protein
MRREGGLDWLGLGKGYVMTTGVGMARVGQRKCKEERVLIIRIGLGK